MHKLSYLLCTFVMGCGFCAELWPPPTLVKQTEVQKLVHELFKADYAKSSNADKRSLVDKLVEQADETQDDPASIYVLLQEAANLAAATGDADEAMELADRLASRFKIDAVAQKKTLLTTAGAANRNPEIMRAISARRALLDKPDDTAAALTLGRYLCFDKNDWEAGLPYLKNGNDAGLKAVAEKELAKPKEALDQLSVADAWWELADKQPRNVKADYLSRAKSWYQQAAPTVTGLNKTKAEKRLAEIDNVLAAENKSLPGGTTEINAAAGRFYVSALDYATVYVNQVKVHQAAAQAKSRELFLKEGDLVVVQVERTERKAKDRRPRVLAVFQSNDNRWCLCPTAEQWHDVTTQKMETLTPITVLAQKDKVKTARIRQNREFERLQTQGLLDGDFDQAYGTQEKSLLAFVVTRAMFKPVKAQNMAIPAVEGKKP